MSTHMFSKSNCAYVQCNYQGVVILLKNLPLTNSLSCGKSVFQQSKNP